MVTVVQDVVDNDFHVASLIEAGATIFRINCARGPCVVKISPVKNVVGGVICPAKVWLSPQGTGLPPPHVSPDVILHMNGQEFQSKLEVDDSVRFCDAHGKLRALGILSKYPTSSGVGFIAECRKTEFVESGTVLRMKEKGRKSSVGFVIDVPPAEQFLNTLTADMVAISFVRDVHNIVVLLEELAKTSSGVPSRAEITNAAKVLVHL
ncbi:unnamed protein product [Fraxinus pennsylvanica]|uniref:Pyruvate kinase n=1 Tax=Fraxinus pennsylvanica TaxID=56036 RepID=A0AAD1Z419_9LAMI|nr:unnamed protein product [Fraxinus pennsylvanica]